MGSQKNAHYTYCIVNSYLLIDNARIDIHTYRITDIHDRNMGIHNWLWIFMIEWFSRLIGKPTFLRFGCINQLIC